MRHALAPSLFALALAGAASAAHAGGFLDALKKFASNPTTQSTAQSAAGALGQTEIANGLKEALSQGVTKAITTLGTTDGFWKDSAVKIPLPGFIQPYETLARNFGFGTTLDSFQLSLNRAAEKAVPEVASIFGNAVSQMSLADAQSILKGQNNAATEFFRRTAGTQLADKIKPIVTNATAQAGVAQQYKKLTAKAGPVLQLAGNTAPQDLDAFVTQKAVDGLFVKIGDEEARIRANPAARSTELLKKVFANQK